MCTGAPALPEVQATSLKGSRASPEPPRRLTPQQGLGSEGVSKVLALSPEMKVFLLSISVEACENASGGGARQPFVGARVSSAIRPTHTEFAEISVVCFSPAVLATPRSPQLYQG